MSKHPFRGMGVALVTPFTESQEVDYKSLERLLEHLLRDGATDFIVIHGTTGESPCLTREERQRVTDHVVEQVAGRCPLMVGLGVTIPARRQSAFVSLTPAVSPVSSR